MKFSVNRADAKISLYISFIVSLIAGIICFFVDDICDKNVDLKIAYSATIETLSVFSLTFLGFILTAFTILQVFQSKSWFERIKETSAFDKLINAFKLLILVSTCGIFISLFQRIGISLFTYKYIFIVGVCFSSFVIAFLCTFAWKTISGIIELFKI